MRKVLCAAVSAVALFSFSAVAQDSRARTGLYVKGSLGYSWSPQDEIDYSSVWGLGVGYRFMPNVRADFTVDWRDRYVVEGGQGLTLTGRPINSEVDNRTMMVNVYYDFAPFTMPYTSQSLRPYVGVGAGLSRTEVDDVDIVITNQNRLESFFGSDRDQFAWQLMAGAQLDLGERAFLDLGYRYADLGDLRLSSTAGRIDNDLRGHELVASVGFRF